MAARTARPGLGGGAISALALPFVSEEQRRAVARAAHDRCVCGGVACGKSHQNWRDMGRCGSTESGAQLFAVPVGLVGITGEPGELVAFCGECPGPGGEAARGGAVRARHPAGAGPVRRRRDGGLTVLYFANPSTAAIRQHMSGGRLGCIITPKQGNHLPPDAPWIADNGRGPGRDGKPGLGYPGDRAYLEWLSRGSARGGRRCLFAVAPDVLGDAAATIERSAPFVYKLRAWFGLPGALVAQDGQDNLDVPWTWFDVLFIGGSTAWKLGPAARDLTAQAKARGKWVHMGRVNSLRRLRYAAAIGCDSADGTTLTRAPDLHLPAVLGWDRAVNDQGALFDLDGVA
jgi:hypothetical protein